MASVAPKTVGIIGAGIAGPTFALQLLSNPSLRSRFRPLLFDQAASPRLQGGGHRAGATVGLFANGLYPLYQLGLRDAIDQAGFECRSMSVWDCDGAGASEFRLTQPNVMWSHGLQKGVFYFERRRLQSVLLDKVRELGGEEVSWNRRAVGVETLPSGRTRVTFDDGQSVDLDLLVGSDGGYSRVRRHILDQRNPKTAEERWLPDHMGVCGFYGVSNGVQEPNPSVPFSDSHCIWLKEGGCLASGPCPDGRFRWDLLLPEDLPPPVSEAATETPSRGTEGQEAWQSALVPSLYTHESSVDTLRRHCNVFHPYARNVKGLLDTSDRIIRTSLRQRVWGRDEIQCGSVVLMGDAGRLMLPTSGQGTGFAVEDATVLAGILLKQVTSGAGDASGSMRQALEEYARLRHPRSVKMAWTAKWTAKVTVGSTWYWRAARHYATKWGSRSKET